MDPTTTSNPIQQPSAPPPGPQTQNPPVTATIPEQTPQAAPPKVLVPEKQGGLAGIVDEIRGALAPRSQNVYRDPETGERYVQDKTATPGQQWRQIAGEAIDGAARGLAAGRGAGNKGKAALAGVEAGEQRQQQARALADKQAEEDYEIARQNRIDKANTYMQQLDAAQKIFAAKRLQVEMTHEQVQWAQQANADEHTAGSIDLGVYPDHFSLPQVEKEHPEIQFWKTAVNGGIHAHPEVGEDGKIEGVHLWMPVADSQDQAVAPGTKALFLDHKSDGTPFLRWFTPNGQQTVRTIKSYNDAANSGMMAYQKAQAENKLKAQQTVTASTAATKNVAEANKANADAKKEKQDTTTDGSLVDMIGVGKMAPERMAYLLSRNQELAQQVAAKYPDYDSSKAAQYPKLYAEFTSGKKGSVGYQLNAGAAAFKHLYELRELNTPMSHVPHSAAWTAYMNKADTVSTELANFYGDATIPGIEHIKATLTSTLPGNRDSAIRTQAQSMSDKVDNFAMQWKNGAPSKYYEDKMPGMDDAANAARAELDPRYATRVRAQQTQPAPQQVAIHPSEAQIKLANGNIGVVRNGQWVDTGRKAQ